MSHKDRVAPKRKAALFVFFTYKHLFQLLVEVQEVGYAQLKLKKSMLLLGQALKNKFLKCRLVVQR